MINTETYDYIKSSLYDALKQDESILTYPERVIGYLADICPNETDFLLELKPAIMSGAGLAFIKYRNEKNINVQMIYTEVRNKKLSGSKSIESFLRLLFDIYDLNEKYSDCEEPYEIPAEAYVQESEKSELQPIVEKDCEELHNNEARQLSVATDEDYRVKHELAISYIKNNQIEKGCRLLVEVAELSNDAQIYFDIYRYRDKIPLSLLSADSRFDYLKKAAEAGLSDAQMILADLYYANDVSEDYIKAFNLYKDLSEKGNGNATYKLALCYRFGHGTKTDSKAAMESLKLAAELGNERAKTILR